MLYWLLASRWLKSWLRSTASGGTSDAGEKIQNDTDAKTGIPIVSLYGKSKKPTAAMLEDIDIVLFDLQDVGARFYTYISTLLHYVMEACGELGKN